MQELPLVTIITPSYNQGRFIEETVLSVLNQDYPYIEYIVMDGGSTDQTLNILKKYNNRLIWFSEKDKGQSHAINKGLSLAKGDILAYLNSDDVYLPGAITRAVRYLTSENPVSHFVYGEGYMVTAGGEIIDRFPTKPFDSHLLIEDDFILQPTAFWKRAVFEKIGFFNENLHYAMDYDYWIRIVKQYNNLGYISDYLANARFYPETKTMSRRCEGIGEVLNLIAKHYGKGNVPSSWIYEYARQYMKLLFPRETSEKKSFFILGLNIIAAVKFLEYNHTVPVSEMKRRGLLHMRGVGTRKGG